MRKLSEIFYFILQLTVAAFIVLCIWATWQLWVSDYNNFTLELARQYQVTAQLLTLRSKFITPATYFGGKFVLPVQVALGSYGFVLLKKYKRKAIGIIYGLLHAVSIFIKEYIRIFKSLKPAEKGFFYLILVILFGTRIYFAYTFPIHIDEAFSYVHMISKGLLATISYYPGPNNHVGYLILSNITHHLTGNPAISLRAPSVIISTLVSLMLFLSVKKYFNFETAALGTVFFNFSETSLFYATHGRGYFLVVLLFFISYIASYKLWQKYNRAWLTIHIAVSAYGFYTIPVFLYAYLSILLFFILKSIGQWKKIKTLFVAGFYTAIATVILYLPIIVVNGIKALTGNQWVKPINFYQWLKGIGNYLLDFFRFIYGEGLLGIALFSAMVYFIFRKLPNRSNKIQNLRLGLIATIASPLLMLPLQQVLPPERTWLYLSGVLYYLTGFCVFEIIGKKIRQKYKVKQVITGITAAYIVVQISIITYKNSQTDVYDISPRTISKILIDQHIAHIFVDEDLYQVFIRYRLIESKRTIAVSSQYNANTTYDYLVLAQHSPKVKQVESLKRYRYWYADGFVRIYKKYN